MFVASDAQVSSIILYCLHDGSDSGSVGGDFRKYKKKAKKRGGGSGKGG